MSAKRAQSINEYAMVIIVVTLAAVAMQTYIKRGIQSVIKGTADVLAVGGKTETSALVPIARLKVADGIIYDKTRWNTAFINEYIVKVFGGSKKTKRRADGSTYVDIDTGWMTGAIRMVKEGNDVYYYHYPNLSDLSNRIIVAAEDALTGILTTFSPVDGQADATYKDDGTLLEVYTHLDLAGVRIRDKTFSPYRIVRLSDDVAAQQKGIGESGLFDYKQTGLRTAKNPTGGLVVTNNPSDYPGVQPKKVTVTEFASSNVTIPYTSYNNYMRLYRATDVKTKIKGNNVYYYLIATDALIGIEDAFTRDLTTFDENGFVNWVFGESGPYSTTEIKVTSNYDPVETTKVISATVEKKVGANWVTVGTYGKYQPVRISQTAATNPFTDPLPEMIVRKTVSSETTNVSGSWEATYQLGAETFGSLEKRKPGATTPPKPGPTGPGGT